MGPYHKVDPTVLWFVNTVGCRRRLILACSMQASAFTMSCPLDCYNNCIYKGDWNGDVPVYDIHDITARQSIRYFDSEDWESQEILVEYNWLVAQRAHQALEQTPNDGQTMCRQVLDDWALSTWPNFGLDKLKFPLMWRQKLCKAGRRITSVEALGRELSPSCILELSCLKNHANHLVYLLVVHTESNTAEEPAPVQLQQFVLGNVATPGTQRPRGRPKLPEHIHQAKMERQAKEIFQMKVSKCEEQKCLIAGIQRATVEANRGRKRRGADEQL